MVEDPIADWESEKKRRDKQRAPGDSRESLKWGQVGGWGLELEHAGIRTVDMFSQSCWSMIITEAIDLGLSGVGDGLLHFDGSRPMGDFYHGRRVRLGFVVLVFSLLAAVYLIRWQRQESERKRRVDALLRATQEWSPNQTKYDDP
jgi:hypothetical protein